jgi:hypothetical protein
MVPQMLFERPARVPFSSCSVTSLLHSDIGAMPDTARGECRCRELGRSHQADLRKQATSQAQRPPVQTPSWGFY